MSAVRPEFGPTLGELLGPRWRALPRAARLALVALAVLLLVALVASRLGGGANPLKVVVVREAPSFNFAFRPPFARLAPQAGEIARVGGRGQSFAVRRLRLPAYRGDAAGFLPVYAAQLQPAMARRFPQYLLRSEGRANVNRIQGYEIVFQFRRNGRLSFGRRILLLPTVVAREGVDLELVAPRTPAVARADAVGHNGPLKTSLRSFRFGTERP